MQSRSVWQALTAGVVATLAGLAVAHLVAGATDPAASPVAAVAATVIDLTPTPLKEWAVATLGTADKPVLLGSVAAVTLVLAGVAGLMAARRFPLGAAALVTLAGVAGAMALARPTATAVDALPALVAGLVGVGTLRLLVGPAAEGGQGAAGPGPGRRTFLLLAGSVGVAAAATAAAGRWLALRRVSPGDVTLPAAGEPRAPLPSGVEADGVSPFRTPTGDFYRVDTRVTLPVVPPEDWTLTVDGDVEAERTWTFEEILALPLVERDITMTCVSNEVGGPYVGSARWLGVPLPRLLDEAGIDGTGADQILSTDVDGMTISTPLEVALDGREPLLAVGMNGGPLPQEHGFPARLVTPGLYGYVGSTKWVTRLTLTTYAEQQAYWTERGWATRAPVRISSRIDTPRPLSDTPAGEVVVAGVAWAQRRGVAKVEVRVDGGRWQEARLGPDAGVDYWRQWFLPWRAEPGRHLLAVRATSEHGEVQTATRTSPFPDGSTGVQEIVVRIS
jgi:DMSO/TMAO reductase YedYZ molybdopterin-dependent catalytic subunit